MCLRSHSKQEAELGFKYRHSFQSLLFQIPCYLWVAVVQSLNHVWCSVTSHSLTPHGLQHARLSCPPLSPRVCSNSYPLSQWCHPTISSSVVPFSCLQSFPVSGSFPMSRLFASGGPSISFIKYILVSWNLLVLIATSQLWFNHHTLSPFEPMSCRL